MKLNKAVVLVNLLYRDILNWEKWKKGKELTTIEVQRLLERFNKKFEETDDKLFKLDDLKQNIS